jgi:hypothetical protein
MIEDVSAKLGIYLLIISFLIFLGIITSIRNIPMYIPAIMVIVGFLLLALSFGMFYWQIRPPRLDQDLFYMIILLPIVLYIPVNLALFSFGVVEPKLQDFGAYYNAAVRWLHNAPLYEPTREIPALNAKISGDMPYLYPPVFILIFLPFTFLPPIISGVVWDLIALIFLIWSVSKLISTFNVSMNRKERFIIYLIVTSFAPTITWMKAGQVSGLLAGFLCLSGATLRSNRHRASGVLITLGSIVKPFYATSGAYLLRNRKRLITAAISGVIIFISGLLIFGISAHIEYLDVLKKGKGWETAVRPAKWNAGHFNPFYVLGPLKHFPRAIIALAISALALRSNKTDVPIEYIFALGVAIVPLVGPTTNTLALNAVIPAILMTGFYELEKKGEFPKKIAISMLLIHIHPYTVEFMSKFGPKVYPPLELLTPLIPLLQPALYGMGLLVGYLVYRSWKNPVI